MERQGLVQFLGKDATVIGANLAVGSPAPDFTAQAADWSPFNLQEKTAGKVTVLLALPSVYTSVCNREAHRFNEEAASLSPEIIILSVSMDLPWSLKAWCAASGVDRVVTLSDHMQGEFGEKYGVLIKEGRVFRRAVWVINAEGRVVYAAYMPALGVEPDYPEVLAAARQALSELAA